MIDLEVIDEPAAATAALDPLRARILAVLAEPGSATTVAAAIGESRQKVNYHLRALEEHGLVQFVEERPRRGFTERVVVASARSYVVSPAALGESAVDPARTDRLSTRYLVAVAARMVREVAELARAADAAVAECDPVDDQRGSIAFKQSIVKVLVKRGIGTAKRRCQGEAVEVSHEYY